MKKPYKFTELSETTCADPDCRKPLKKNVVQRKSPQGKLLICWECWVMKTRKMALTAYKKYRTLRAKIRAEGGDVRAAHTATF